ncbi:MAG: electron transfer flavoprotein subunit alpha/FixB family protein [Gemmatimonadetes bacterium]|nr:electron transfer flavoprotein subunit alpha/FixB family protein [Gemmatimonadota bacterium]
MWVFAEERGGTVKPTSWEVLGVGQRLAGELGKPLAAVIAGSDVGSAAGALAAKELSRVLALESPALDPYTPDAHTRAVREAIESESPDLILFSHTYRIRDFVPKLAAALDRPYVPDCVGVTVEDGQPVFVRQVFQGKIDARVAVRGEGPWLATLQNGAFPAEDVRAGAAAAPVERRAMDSGGAASRTTVLEVFEGVKDKVDLTRAEVIVAVGRGIGKQENLKIVQELADAFGAELAASRPVCDNEWLPMDRQIGSSGQTVSPRLYIAVGISGAIQHLVGMKGAATIVAINKDPNAPIFQVADYGIVGDLFEVVPALTALARAG